MILDSNLTWKRLDMKMRFTAEPIIGFLREAEAGLPIAELCRKHAFYKATYYLWRINPCGCKA